MKNLLKLLAIALLFTGCTKDKHEQPINIKPFSTVVGNPFSDTGLIKMANRVGDPIPVPFNAIQTLTNVSATATQEIKFMLIHLKNAQGGGVSVMNISSIIKGSNLAHGWLQTKATYTNYPNSALLTITIEGTEMYLTAVHGPIDAIDVPVTIKINYNTNDGSYSISSTPGTPGFHK